MKVKEESEKVGLKLKHSSTASRRQEPVSACLWVGWAVTMRGWSKGRKSSRAKSHGKSPARGRVRVAPDHVPRDPDPPESQKLGKETKAAQVQAGAGRGGLETTAPAPPSPVRVRGCLPAPPGLWPRAPGPGGRNHVQVVTRPSPGKATSLPEHLVTNIIFMWTVGRPKNGPRAGNRLSPAMKKAPDTCSEGERVSSLSRWEAEERDHWGVCLRSSGREDGECRVRACGDRGQHGYAESSSRSWRPWTPRRTGPSSGFPASLGSWRLHRLEHWNLLIQNIPGFWGQDFQNHSQLSSFLNNQDKEVLSYLNSLEVEELGLVKLVYKIKFYFGCNPYFQNTVLIKEYGRGPAGQVVSHSTPIQWLLWDDLQILSPEKPDNSQIIFGWFSYHSSIESDKIVEIIKEE